MRNRHLQSVYVVVGGEETEVCDHILEKRTRGGQKKKKHSICTHPSWLLYIYLLVFQSQTLLQFVKEEGSFAGGGCSA